MVTNPAHCRVCGIDLLSGSVCAECSGAADVVDGCYEGIYDDLAADAAEE